MAPGTEPRERRRPGLATGGDAGGSLGVAGARVAQDADYRSPPIPVSTQHLLDEGLSPQFVTYMRNWPGFVESEAAE